MLPRDKKPPYNLDNPYINALKVVAATTEPNQKVTLFVDALTRAAMALRTIVHTDILPRQGMPPCLPSPFSHVTRMALKMWTEMNGLRGVEWGSMHAADGIWDHCHETLLNLHALESTHGILRYVNRVRHTDTMERDTQVVYDLVRGLIMGGFQPSSPSPCLTWDVYTTHTLIAGIKGILMNFRLQSKYPVNKDLPFNLETATQELDRWLLNTYLPTCFTGVPSGVFKEWVPPCVLAPPMTFSAARRKPGCASITPRSKCQS